MSDIKGVEEIKEIKTSIHDGNIFGILLGLGGMLFIGMTVYSLYISAQANKLNIKKLNSEGFH